MQKTITRSLFALATLASALPAAAQMADRSIAVIPRAGILGVGADISIPLNESFNARIGYGSWKKTGEVTESDVRYDGTLNFSGSLAVLDWFPTGGNFRLTVGAAKNLSNIKVTARPTTSTTFGNNTYAANTISADGELDFRATAPYIGIGYGNASARSRIGFFLEGGLIRQKTKATLNGTCSAPADCTQFNADLANERASLQESADKMKWFPVLQVGMSIRF